MLEPPEATEDTQIEARGFCRNPELEKRTHDLPTHPCAQAIRLRR
jgi:hypothetical protein